MGMNTQTVIAVYDSFKTGDVPVILSKLTDNVDWMDFPANRAAAAGIPWFVRRRGKAEVPKFFQGIAENLDFDDFTVGDIVESGNHVVAQVHLSATFKKTGAKLKQQDLHWWTFDPNGKISAYRHYTDTADVLSGWNQLAKAA
jgi:uncharacterized protein